MKCIGGITGTHGARDIVVRSLVNALNGTFIQRGALVPDDTDIFISWRFNISPSPHIMCVGLDVGYFDLTKFETYSISINGVHGNSLPINVQGLSTRPKPDLQPWREGGEHVQILEAGYLSNESIRNDASNQPIGWTEEALKKAQVFKAPITVRPHPRGLRPGEPVPGPIEETFESTLVSISYGSHTAIQTVIGGVPTIVEATRCPAYAMASQDYEITRPDREEWLHDLSYRVYGAHETEAAVEYIKRGYEQLQCSV